MHYWATIFNLFFEDSTRTRTSFEVAAKRLGADLINVAVKDSSINKGETLLDTMTTINSMNPDVLIVRHPDEGISKKISKVLEFIKWKKIVINEQPKIVN